jgi:hypothetical protein
MEGAWLQRVRWRRRGAWLWPAFVALTVLDGVVGHLLPPAGETETLAAAVLLGLVLNVIAVLLLSRPFGALARRIDGALPRVVARNYGGTAAVILVAGVLLAAGLMHQPTIQGDQRALRDAVTRAQAWIGFRAPAEFRRNLQSTNTYAIEPGSIYRTCVPNEADTRTYCVIVKLAFPFPGGVSFAGYEPNSILADGTN